MEITELASEQVESVWIKLMYKKKTSILGVVYRPPYSSNDYFNCVLNQIDHAHFLNENIIHTRQVTRATHVRTRVLPTG